MLQNFDFCSNFHIKCFWRFFFADILSTSFRILHKVSYKTITHAYLVCNTHSTPYNMFNVRSELLIFFQFFTVISVDYFCGKEMEFPTNGNRQHDVSRRLQKEAGHILDTEKIRNTRCLNDKSTVYRRLDLVLYLLLSDTQITTRLSIFLEIKNIYFGSRDESRYKRDL